MSKDELICVDCPHCGHTHQKSFITNSVIVCENCHKSYWTLVDEGFCLTAKLEARSKLYPDADKMASYAKKLNALANKVK